MLTFLVSVDSGFQGIDEAGYRAMNHPVIGVVTKADLASMEQISLVKSWLREAGAHNVLVTSAVNNNGVTELFALLHTEEGCC
ncbi:TPA: ethanolamine utilization protein [Escherichia coli]|nr:ethanolamine utilization protein [Escherichia coli]EIA2107241.1 ethanolamine utilization protein [Escherichia coli]ELY7517558.1 ethanolamine utilization protein [Escherichia coli]HCU2515699.1 ethanolamine utilization protein [Escherichia coli]